MKWEIYDKEIDNKMSEFSKYIVVVSREHVCLLDKYNIPYRFFSNALNECYFVRDGKGLKKKRFNDLQVQEIKELHSNGLSYRVLANKFNCSTRTIYLILNDLY